MIFPIRGGGVHEDKSEARAAIGVYRTMLEQNPGDRTARYLLNIGTR